MNRRELLKFGAAAGVATFVTFPAVSIAGCSTQAEITNAINVILNSAEAVIKVAEPNAPWLGPLASAIAALQQAESTWTAGGAITLIDDALNTLSAVLAVIPVTAVYAPLIAILVAGIEACLALIPVSLKSGKTAVGNPYRGRVELNNPHWFQTRAGAYKAQWNSQATVLSLPAARI
jgi:hypothetical protein